MMRIFAFLAVMITSGISGATAADLGGKGSALDAVLTASASSNTPFAGAYVGVQAGGEFTSIEFDGFDGQSADGLTGGAHGGYRWVIARNILAGPWIEGGISNVNSKEGGRNAMVQDWYAAGGGDLCMAVGAHGQTAICARGGYQWAEWSSDFSDGTRAARSWVLGGSIETMLTDHVSAGLTTDYLISHRLEDAGDDVSAEGLRVLGRLTLHQ